jgi:general secretion pathway protein D
VEITRELIYPTEFDPPQVPTNVGQNQILIVGGIQIPLPLPPPVVTPTTPTAFDMRRTGVVLEVEPVISEDGRSVDLAITPEFTEFSGFVNYGTPIFSIFEGNYSMLTDNFIYQPVFDTKKVVTAVNIYDGATVVLGGLVSDNTIITQDKVPIVGDAPVVGRLFRSDVTRRQMKHVLFFVTVKVVDPSGRRVNEP